MHPLVFACVLTARAQSSGDPSGSSNPPASSASSAAPVPSPPAYKQHRYDEDWSGLRDSYNAGRRADLFDVIKYIPLRRDREDWYLTLGGEIRERYERYTNDDFGRVPQDANGYFLQRYMLHANMQMGNRVRVFTEVKSGIEVNRRGGPRSTDEDYLDLHQGFVDVKLGGDPQRTLLLRVGRQEITFGSSPQRLVSVREDPNVRRTFDGVRASFRSGGQSFGVLLTKPVETNQRFFDDGPEPQRTFWGAGYGVRSVAFGPPLDVDVFYLGLDNKQARFDQGIARETRHTVGLRLANTREGERKRGAQKLDFDYEFAYQFGSFGTGSISAYTVTTDTGYTFRNRRTNPRIGVRADIASGDRDPTDANLQTFNALFPTGEFFGKAGLIGPYNFIDVHPTLELEVTKQVSFSAESAFIWRQSLSDGIYATAGNLLRTGQRSHARFVGNLLSFSGEWQASRHITFTGVYARFFAGQFLREAPSGESVNYFAMWMTYKF